MSFDATSRGGVGGGVGLAGPIRRASTLARPGAAAAADLRAALGEGPFAAVLVFASEDRDLEDLGPALKGAFGDAPVLGAASCGQIGPAGAETGAVAALALPRDGFRVSWRIIDGADRFRRADGESLSRAMMSELTARGGMPAFGLMLTDAAAAREEALAFAFGGVERNLPFAGGSFGDRASGFVLAEGRFRPRAAAAVYVAGPVEASVLRFDDLAPTETRMVITACDADHRRVTELNGEPAAPEYARLCGIDPAALDAVALATHPLLAAEGGALHGRTLRAAEPDGALVFSAAVEEGMILRLARHRDPAATLEARLPAPTAPNAPQATIVFEDVARRRAAEASQSGPAVNAALARIGAVGAATRGQQAGRMHCAGEFVGLSLHLPNGRAAP